jgi:hypothetical protein
MAKDIKNLAIQFLREYPDATEAEAIRFIRDRFPESPLSIAEFLRDWLQLRDRLVAARNTDGVGFKGALAR